MRATQPNPGRTLGGELERDRLTHRIRRTTVAIAALREHLGAQGRELGVVPVHIRQAMADFESRLGEMNARLLDLAPEPAAVQEAQRPRTAAS